MRQDTRIDAQSGKFATLAAAPAAAPSGAGLEIRGLEHRFGELAVLDGLSPPPPRMRCSAWSGPPAAASRRCWS